MRLAAARLGDNASPSVSFFFFCSSLSLLRSQTCSRFLLLPFLKLLYAGFLTATNILPRGQDLPLNMHARAHACMCTHIPTLLLHICPLPPFLSYIRTHIAQLPLYACFKEITEASKKRERIYLCASAPIIQYLHYAFRETNPCHAGNALRALDIKGCIGKTGIHYKAYIYFTLI